MVNPADGNVSFNLPITTPKGRGIQFPFSIKYTSAEPFYLEYASQDGTGAHWRTPIQNADPHPFDVNGWSYSLPNYTAQSMLVGSYPVNCSPWSPCDTYNSCYATADYTFQGLDEVSRTLNVGNLWLGSGSSNVSQDGCGIYGYGGSGGYSGFNLDGVSAILGAAILPGENYQPSMVVTDKDGTVYRFPQNTSFIVGKLFGGLAQSVTDRNGNTISLIGTDGSVGGSLPTGSYIDTAGRPILSWTGIGSSSNDSLQISGLGAIVVKWTTTTVTMPSSSTFLSSTDGSSCGVDTSSPLVMSVVSEIDLPNNTKYSFSYGDQYGFLNKITFPDGGYVRYTWGLNQQSKVAYDVYSFYAPNKTSTGSCYFSVDTPGVIDRYESFDGVTETFHQHFSYATQLAGSRDSWSSKTTTVTSEDGITGQTRTAVYGYVSGTPQLGVNDGPHPQTGADGSFVSAAEWQIPQIPLEAQTVQQDDSGVLMTTNKTWYDEYTVLGEQHILNDQQGSTVLHCPDLYDNIVATYEYDYQQNGAKPSDPPCSQIASGLSAGLNISAIGPLLRQTLTSFHSFGQSSNIMDRPNSVTVKDGAGNQVKQTLYAYDGSVVVTSGTEVGLSDPPGPRANLTSVTQWLNNGQSSPTTSYTYFDNGQVESVTDPCGNSSCGDMAGSAHTTTFSYRDSWASSDAPPGQTNSLLTSLTNSLGQASSYSYDYATANVVSSVDPNGQVTTYAYSDPLLRITDVYEPASAQNNGMRPHTQLSYTDGPGASITQTRPTGVTSTSLLDGFDRVIQAQVTSDPFGMDLIDMTYDAYGNMQSASTPYRQTTDSTYGITSFLYDGLNRKVTQCQPDNGSVNTTVCSPTNSFQSWQYIGSQVTFVDEQGNQWTRGNDSLGRLVSVTEPGGLHTSYSYNPLNDLVSATQSGATGDVARTRRFAVDSLSRLIASQNPESGTGLTCPGARGLFGTCFSYDANGDLQSTTNARGVTTKYVYDGLNRLLSKTYQGDVVGTPSSCYQYDTSTVPGAGGNLIGRLTNTWTQKGSCPDRPALSSTATLSRRSMLSYDSNGRLLIEQQCTFSKCASGTPYSSVYDYDLIGNITHHTNGIGTLVFTNCYNSANRLILVVGTDTNCSSPSYAPNASLFASPSYNASGSLTAVTLGTGLSLSRTYDSRLRITSETDIGNALPNPTSGTATITLIGTDRTN